MRLLKRFVLGAVGSSAASFNRRLELIESAKTSIELEFFIYDVDDASRLPTQALMRKPREGVHVRILVDFSAPVFKLKPAYAHVLGEAGVKVRYYNTSAVYRWSAFSTARTASS